MIERFQLGKTERLGSVGAKAFLVEVNFSNESSSITASPADEKLASVMSAICLFGKGWLRACSQHQSQALLIPVSFSNRSGVTRTLTSFFQKFEK